MNEAFNRSFLRYTIPNRETEHMITILPPATAGCCTRQVSPLHLEIAAITGLHALTYSFCSVANYNAIYILMGLSQVHLSRQAIDKGELCLWLNLSTLSSKTVIPGIFPFKHLHEEQTVAQ